MSKLYVACAFAFKNTAKIVAADLDRSGFSVTATWFNSCDVSDAHLTDDQRRAATQQCLVEVSRADCLLVLAHLGHPRMTYVEVGYALALGKPIVWICKGPDGRALADSHPKVVRLDVADERGPSGSTWKKLERAIGEALGR